MLPIIIRMYRWKFCSKFNFITVFLILANLGACVDHTKKNADVSDNSG